MVVKLDQVIVIFTRRRRYGYDVEVCNRTVSRERARARERESSRQREIVSERELVREGVIVTEIERKKVSCDCTLLSSSIGKVERPNSLSGEYSGFSTSEECGEHRVTKTLICDLRYIEACRKPIESSTSGIRALVMAIQGFIGNES
ncbi:hypothetical protein YC2023_109256 [Brassica napus]